MAFFVSPPPECPLRLKPLLLTIGTTGGALKVTDAAGDPAAGRTVLLLKKGLIAGWAVVAETQTDSNGDYEFSINASVNERMIVVGVGDSGLDEYTVALGNLTGVEP